MNTVHLLLLTLIISFAPVAASAEGNKGSSQAPNIIIIMTDDQGYADVGKFGAKGFSTPHLDRMADEGLRFTNWYVPQAVCGASRAGLLTGCYPNRINMLGAPGPSSLGGIADDEEQITAMLKARGYTPPQFGK